MSALKANTHFYRFKNFEAGRLTSLSTAPRKERVLQDQTSEYGSESDLSKGGNDEKSFGGTTVAEEANGDLDLEIHGTSITSFLRPTTRLT